MAATGSALAQEDQGSPPPETVTVTFELTIEGTVPEGRTFGLGYKPIGNLLRDFRGVVFCTTDLEDPEPTEAGLPPCEDGGTYYGTLEVPTGVPLSFDFLYNADADDVRCDYIGLTEVFYSDTRTFNEDSVVHATYVEDGLPPAFRAVGDNGEPGNGGTSGKLPSTGGPPLLPMAGIAGALLVIGALVVRRYTR
jgi:hypothetical protein